VSADDAFLLVHLQLLDVVAWKAESKGIVKEWDLAAAAARRDPALPIVVLRILPFLEGLEEEAVDDLFLRRRHGCGRGGVLCAV
jgi:hypothetical protein